MRRSWRLNSITIMDIDASPCKKLKREANSLPILVLRGIRNPGRCSQCLILFALFNCNTKEHRHKWVVTTAKERKTSLATHFTSIVRTVSSF